MVLKCYKCIPKYLKNSLKYFTAIMAWMNSCIIIQTIFLSLSINKLSITKTESL